MDYEKLYKEAIERAKEDISSGILARRETARYIFPELRENSEEMVRRTIISTLYRDDYLSTEEVNECVAWLEKQGNTIPDECVFRPVVGCDIESAAKQAIKQQGVLAKKVVLAFNGAYIPVGGKAADIIINEYNSWLEKKGNDSYLQEKIESFTNAHKGEDPEGIIAACRGDEKQGEHKPVNEPKFKVGDWINGYYASYKVLSVNNKWYAVEDTDGNKINILFENEKFHHLWTIQDAKEGDVLYSPCLSLLWIFKSKDTVYCGCNLNYNDGAFCGEGYFERPTDAIPATKEQRDLLFQKMKDAGYEWDAEKKELKKIAKFKVGDTIRLKNSLAEFTIESISDGRYYFKGGSIDIIACDRDYYKLAVPKHSNLESIGEKWSEEDERVRKSIIELVEWVKEQQIHTDHNTDGTKWDDMIAWLKKKGEKTVIGNGSNSASVSDGDTSVTNKEVVSQQTGWSKEDTDFKTESVSYLCNLRDTFEERKWDTKPIQRCINWLLEFPKPQFYWKPSKEQMEALNKVMEMPLHTELYLRLSELYNDLS